LIVVTIHPIIRDDLVRMLRAISFGLNFSSRTAAYTFPKLTGLTPLWLLSTFETVPKETPARRATSLMVAGVFIFRPRSVFFTVVELLLFVMGKPFAGCRRFAISVWSRGISSRRDTPEGAQQPRDRLRRRPITTPALGGR